MKNFCAMLIAGAVLASAPHIRAEVVNGIQAVVHDSVITYQQVAILNAQAANELRHNYADQPELLYKKAAEVQTNNLEKLMREQLILHEFKTAGYNLPESVIDDEVKERIRAEFGDRMRMTKTLEARGMTYEKYREQVRDQFIIRAMRGKFVASEVIISPHKVEAYYLAHREEPKYKVDDQVRLRMIVLNKSGDTDARKLGEEILTKLKEGASFAEMATVYSQGSQRKDGGDWGWWERKSLRKELADVASTLKPGERSDIIDTPESCYIMLLEDSKPAHYKSLGEVREEIETNLILEERGRLEKQWIDRLKKKTFVRTLF